MDTSRLPSGASFHTYAHPNTKLHVQRCYTKDDVVNPKSVIGVVRKKMDVKAEEVVHNGSVMDTVVIEESLTPVPPSVPEPVATAPVPTEPVATEPVATAPADEFVITHVAEPVASGKGKAKAKTPKVAEGVDAWMFIICAIDEMVGLYTENMVRDAIDVLKERLTILMTSGVGHKLFGPKKSRIILAWITNNKRGTPASDESAAVVAEFISWFLDVPIATFADLENTKKAAKTACAEWVMIRKRGCWVLRKIEKTDPIPQ